MLIGSTSLRLGGWEMPLPLIKSTKRTKTYMRPSRRVAVGPGDAETAATMHGHFADCRKKGFCNVIRPLNVFAEEKAKSSKRDYALPPKDDNDEAEGRSFTEIR